ncbi:MAG TPA: dihydrofolate reductase family protein [Bacteroidia bacterium]|nr:dihydrofolate reductase family protein [Bacteroidia bacterium]HRH09211.1 dihydrofolate reductase family protein [Bacteroidia bacterium]
MRNVILYIAASLDNYIARLDGNVDWLDYPDYHLPNEDYCYSDFYKNIDTTLMGNNTYKTVLGFDVPFPYPDKTNYIFTRSTNEQDNEFVKFISGDIVKFVQQLKNVQGQDIWLIGGGQINTLLLNNDLIDKIILTIVPITIGQGIPLFDGKGKETKFTFEKSKSFETGLVQLTFKKKD